MCQKIPPALKFTLMKPLKSLLHRTPQDDKDLDHTILKISVFCSFFLIHYTAIVTTTLLPTTTTTTPTTTTTTPTTTLTTTATTSTITPITTTTTTTTPQTLSTTTTTVKPTPTTMRKFTSDSRKSLLL